MAPQPATPPHLTLLQAFVNTIDLESGQDDVGTPEGLQAWLTENGLAARGDSFAAGDVLRAQSVREALRDLLFHNNGEALNPAAIETLNQAAAEAPLRAAFDSRGGASLVPGRDGIAAVTAKLLAGVTRAEADGTWWRMKACSATNCKWAFYDNSRNRSRTWCAMGVCGNRAKARNYRQRQKSS
jgi:predicted RNA-binding Zn ribbon-like protein